MEARMGLARGHEGPGDGLPGASAGADIVTTEGQPADGGGTRLLATHAWTLLGGL